MNSQILIGVTRDKKHKVVLDGATYAEIKKAFLGMKTSDEFIKLEATMEEKPESDSEDFNVEEPVKTAPSKKKKGKSS